MTDRFVPDSFVVPTHFQGDGFHLEPLGPQHNGRDYEAWMSSIDHIRSTPGSEDWDWPNPMSLEQNLGDLEHIRARVGAAAAVGGGGDGRGAGHRGLIRHAGVKTFLARQAPAHLQALAHVRPAASPRPRG